MKLFGKKVLLYVEPKFKKNKFTADELTIKMFNELKPIISQEFSFKKIPENWGSYGIAKDEYNKKTVVFRPRIMYMGHHTCVCGANSSGCDYLLSNGLITNLLCVHYLACHRSEIPPSELEKVGNLESSPILLDEDKELFEELVQSC